MTAQETVQKIIADMKKVSTPQRAKISQSFFKTGKGHYGEGDIFIGVTVPETRIIAKKYKETDFNTIKQLLTSEIHEHRLCALLILVEQMKFAVKKKDEKQQAQIFNFLLEHKSRINNWDLVDLSAPQIVGQYLSNTNEGKSSKSEILNKLAHSQNLWDKRIAIVSTYWFIKQSEFEETFRITEILIHDTHDLIHKACGWMLREVGKKDEKALEQFLSKHVHHMPRTMLRYAIERFNKEKREFYLNIKRISTKE